MAWQRKDFNVARLRALLKPKNEGGPELSHRAAGLHFNRAREATEVVGGNPFGAHCSRTREIVQRTLCHHLRSSFQQFETTKLERDFRDEIYARFKSEIPGVN
jgi:hypothetical protein